VEKVSSLAVFFSTSF